MGCNGIPRKRKVETFGYSQVVNRKGLSPGELQLLGGAVTVEGLFHPRCRTEVTLRTILESRSTSYRVIRMRKSAADCKRNFHYTRRSFASR